MQGPRNMEHILWTADQRCCIINAFEITMIYFMVVYGKIRHKFNFLSSCKAALNNIYGFLYDIILCRLLFSWQKQYTPNLTRIIHGAAVKIIPRLQVDSLNAAECFEVFRKTHSYMGSCCKV